MTQPLDRNCRIKAQGDLNQDAGEFWVENPFQMETDGHNLSAYERNKVFLNSGGEEFVDLSFGSGADIDSDSRSVVVADFDGDGASDLLVGSVGGGPLRLFLNRIPQVSNRLRVELAGVKSNRDAIGARVIARCGERQIVRDVFANNGFMGQSPPELIFGVGNAETVDELSVRWPSGQISRFQNVPTNCGITIAEGAKEFQRDSLQR